MTEQEERFVHFVFCIDWLNNAWHMLNLIKSNHENPLVGPAFRFALIEYCKPYTESYGAVVKKLILNESCIPKEYKKLHQQILTARKKIHAHSDLTVLEAKIVIQSYKERGRVSIIHNSIHGLEELNNIQTIIELIETTLEKMYIKEELLETELTI